MLVYLSCGVLWCEGQDDVLRVLAALHSAAVASKEHSARSAVRQRRLLSPVTALHWAAHGGHCTCVETLLTFDEWRQVADRPTTHAHTVGDFTAAAGTTPLMLAARAGSSAVIRQIMDAVDDLLVVDRQDDDGLCSRHTCRLQGAQKPLSLALTHSKTCSVQGYIN